jgi:hypothetical protein
MDRTCARVATFPPSSVPRLLCPDCKHHRPDPLTTAVVGPQTAQVLARARAATVEASAAWLVQGLRAYGAAPPGLPPPPLLATRSRLLRLFQDAASPPVVGGPLGKLRPHPTIRVKPQARTRGLPHVPQPDGTGRP